MRLTTRVILIISVCVTTLISIIFYFLTRRFEQQVTEDQLSTARAIYKNILTVRKWVSDQEGVFVHKLPGVHINPFLNHPELVTSAGDTLVLKNPALVTRELSELSPVMGGDFSFHMSSQKYLNPMNKPDSFELAALRHFSDSTAVLGQHEFYRFENINKQRYFRYFAPLYAEESCLRCHSQHISKAGELRGGLSILLSAQRFEVVRNENLYFMARSAIISIFLLSILIFLSIRQSVIKPLKVIEKGAQRIREGDYQFHVEVKNRDEIGSLAKSFEAMRAKIQSYTWQLETSEKKYRSLIEHSLEAVAIVDQEGRILESNSKFSKMSGYSQKELQQIRFDKLLDLKKRQRVLPAKGGTNDAYHYESRLHTRDQLDIPVEIYIIKGVTLGDAADVSFVYIRDLSERKKIEQYAIQTEKMFALGQISSGIAHEIRNPLFALRNNLKYLREKHQARKGSDDLFADLFYSVERIDAIVSAVLDYSRPHKPEYRPISISQVINKSILLVQKQFEKSSIKIVTSFENEHQIIEADEHQLEQVFINMFLNAFEAMQGKGTLKVTTQSSGGRVEIIIADTGRGIPREDIPRIFDPFYSKSHNGTGLGLAIVQRILEQHDAYYHVESEVDAGTTFYISIPFVKES